MQSKRNKLQVVIETLDIKNPAAQSRPHLFLNGVEIKIAGGLDVQIADNGRRAILYLAIENVEFHLRQAKVIEPFDNVDTFDLRVHPYDWSREIDIMRGGYGCERRSKHRII